MQTGLGELRGAIGTQGYDRRLSAEGEDGILLPPATAKASPPSSSRSCSSQRNCFQAAARVENDSVDGTASTFPANFLPPPDTPVLAPSARNFLPISGSLGFL